MSALLFNTPHDPATLAEFSSIHQADHFDIAGQVVQKLGIRTMIMQPLDPIPLEHGLDLLTWLMNHQFVHNEVNGYLGLTGYDLTGVDFRNRQELEIWIRYNALEHFNMNLQLAKQQSS